MPTLARIKVLIGMAICLLLLAACNQDQQQQALGTVERDRIRLSATAAEVITAIHVSEGQQVSAGTPLLQLDDRLQRARVQQAKAEVARAQAYLLQLQNGARAEELASARARVDNAEARLEESEKAYRRTVTLEAKKVLGQADLDRALAQRDAARATLEDAREQLTLLVKGTRPEQLAQADAQLQAANATLALAQEQLQDLTLTATRDGRIDSLPWKLGERVNIGASLVILLAEGNPHIRAYVPESKRALLQTGQTLRVSVDGIDQEFQGQLKRIHQQPAFTPYYALTEEDRSRLMYLAEIQLGDDARHLPSGVPAQVHLK
ncbi:HlyD family efflux transporter periplasmic adaptor subunit [Pseudomaricurvus alkylphenolicus]|nr:HlyD family efflux transporter periplasmic adaptor subunit [Pseudomaricurvus alkylphenolicus]